MVVRSRVIQTDEAPQPRASYSQGIVNGGLVATVQIGDDPRSGDLRDGVAQQTEQTLRNIHAVLKAAGADWSDLIKTTCFLADIRDFAEFDAAYRDMIPEPRPPRATVGVTLAAGILVEIEVLAAAPAAD